MALSRTTGILALFVLGLSVACVALLIALLVNSDGSDTGMDIFMIEKFNFWTKFRIQ